MATMQLQSQAEARFVAACKHAYFVRCNTCIFEMAAVDDSVSCCSMVASTYCWFLTSESSCLVLSHSRAVILIMLASPGKGNQFCKSYELLTHYSLGVHSKFRRHQHLFLGMW